MIGDQNIAAWLELDERRMTNVEILSPSLWRPVREGFAYTVPLTFEVVERFNGPGARLAVWWFGGDVIICGLRLHAMDVRRDDTVTVDGIVVPLGKGEDR